jgi:hypothetical protein
LIGLADKQQELDLPSLCVDDALSGGMESRAAKKKDRAHRGPAAMSHISGVKRPLTHTNSFTGERVPLYGVETAHEEELGKVRAARSNHASFTSSPFHIYNLIPGANLGPAYLIPLLIAYLITDPTLFLRISSYLQPRS